jgi:hypothetical protein
MLRVISQAPSQGDSATTGPPLCADDAPGDVSDKANGHRAAWNNRRGVLHYLQSRKPHKARA